MIIDLATPFWGGLAAGIVLAIIIGLFHYVKMHITVDTLKKEIRNNNSKFDSLQKNYKNKIADIKESHLKVIKNVFVEYQKSVEDILNKYHRLVPPSRLALLEHLDDMKGKNP